MQKHLVRASYEVAYQCIREKASHSAPENLIKPCTIRMVELVLGAVAAKKIKEVPLSNDVIKFFQRHQIEWEKVESVCTDGAPAMIGDRYGFAALVKVLDEIRLVILIFLL